MSYFVGTELGVANLLQRHFDWSSNALWFDEIPNARDPEKTLFLVGGKDAIVNAAVSLPVDILLLSVFNLQSSASKNIYSHMV